MKKELEHVDRSLSALLQSQIENSFPLEQNRVLISFRKKLEGLVEEFENKSHVLTNSRIEKAKYFVNDRSNTIRMDFLKGLYNFIKEIDSTKPLMESDKLLLLHTLGFFFVMSAQTISPIFPEYDVNRKGSGEHLRVCRILNDIGYALQHIKSVNISETLKGISEGYKLLLTGK